MSAPAWFLVAVCLCSFAIVAAMLIGLVREGMRVGRTMMAFGDAAMPITDEISAGADRASAHAAELAERWANLRS